MSVAFAGRQAFGNKAGPGQERGPSQQLPGREEADTYYTDENLGGRSGERMGLQGPDDPEARAAGRSNAGCYRSPGRDKDSN